MVPVFLIFLVPFNFHINRSRCAKYVEEKYDGLLCADDKLTAFFMALKNRIGHINRDVNAVYIPVKLGPVIFDAFLCDILSHYYIRQLYLILHEVSSGCKDYPKLFKDLAGKFSFSQILRQKSSSTSIDVLTVIHDIFTKSQEPLFHLDEETVNCAKDLFKKRGKLKKGKQVSDNRITLLDESSASLQVIFTNHHIKTSPVEIRFIAKFFTTKQFVGELIKWVEREMQGNELQLECDSRHMDWLNGIVPMMNSVHESISSTLYNWCLLKVDKNYVNAGKKIEDLKDNPYRNRIFAIAKVMIWHLVPLVIIEYLTEIEGIFDNDCSNLIKDFNLSFEKTIPLRKIPAQAIGFNSSNSMRLLNHVFNVPARVGGSFSNVEVVNDLVLKDSTFVRFFDMVCLHGNDDRCVNPMETAINNGVINTKPQEHEEDVGPGLLKNIIMLVVKKLVEPSPKNPTVLIIKDDFYKKLQKPSGGSKRKKAVISFSESKSATDQSSLVEEKTSDHDDNTSPTSDINVNSNDCATSLDGNMSHHVDSFSQENDSSIIFTAKRRKVDCQDHQPSSNVEAVKANMKLQVEAIRKVVNDLKTDKLFDDVGNHFGMIKLMKAMKILEKELKQAPCTEPVFRAFMWNNDCFKKENIDEVNQLMEFIDSTKFTSRTNNLIFNTSSGSKNYEIDIDHYNSLKMGEPVPQNIITCFLQW